MEGKCADRSQRVNMGVGNLLHFLKMPGDYSLLAILRKTKSQVFAPVLDDVSGEVSLFFFSYRDEGR